MNSAGKYCCCQLPEMDLELCLCVSLHVSLVSLIDRSVAVNVTNNLKHYLERYDKKGHDHFRIINTTYEFHPKLMTSKFDKLFGGDDALNTNLNEVINENWRELLDDVGPSYNEAFLQIFTTIINRFLAKVSIAELFDDE
jgi:hypothetical protein